MAPLLARLSPQAHGVTGILGSRWPADGRTVRDDWWDGRTVRDDWWDGRTMGDDWWDRRTMRDDWWDGTAAIGQRRPRVTSYASVPGVSPFAVFSYFVCGKL